MFKAFFKLWLVVFVPLFFLIFPNPYSPIAVVNEYAEKNRHMETYRGTFSLIEGELSSVHSDSWSEYIRVLSKEFGYSLSLVPITEAGLTKSQVEDLKHGDFVFVNSEPELLIKAIGGNDQILVFGLDLLEEESILRASKGTVHLLKNRFETVPEDQWSRLIKVVSANFNYSLSLKFMVEMDFSLMEKNLISLYGYAWRSIEGGTLTFYLPLKNGERVLIVEPIATTSITPLLLMVLILVIVLVISIGMFFWVSPLWRDLNRFAGTAKGFGEGDLNLRAELSKTSVIARLGSSFNYMAWRIESLVKGQKDLTDAITHDLRTPLYRLRFAFEMLDDPETKDEVRDKYHAIIRNSIDDLDNLITQALVLSRYNRSSEFIQMEPCFFAKRLKDEIKPFSLEKKDLELELNLNESLMDKKMRLDLRSMLRVANNLISNAVRHASHKVKISLDRIDGGYQLIVEDDGSGIKEDQWHQIFEPFMQVDNRRHNSHSGHGLGLSIVKKIVQLHNGDVSVSWSDLGGARLVVSWPEIIMPDKVVTACHNLPQKGHTT